LERIEEYKGDLKGLFETQPLAVLATHGDGQPYTNLVAFVSSKDLKSLYFATNRATRKFANLSADPRVSMLMDNRSNRVSDFREAMAVTTTGKAFEITGDEMEDVRPLYVAKHPHLQDFISSPGCALIKIQVESYYLVTRFQKVIEIHVRL
jgi:nitroimidazol reductase NimA-like FMN-containing flavoprotein (pyridoxamine 5'-phosphate oxidase superfamily)